AEQLSALGRGAVPRGDQRQGRLVDLEVPGGSLVVWTSPYAPFFGDEELRLLSTLGALTGLALDRVRLFQAEHDARVALERADEVKTNFIALAAHELRTPMTTIHGFVTTLHHLADRLDDVQREAVRDALLQQTQRMSLLVEQLLDLSRLDAQVIDITPERVDVRAQVEEIVHTGTRRRPRLRGRNPTRRPLQSRPTDEEAREHDMSRDRWEEGFDEWTPPHTAAGAGDTAAEPDRESLLRLARELAEQRQSSHGQGNTEVEQLKQTLRERAEAIAAAE